MHDNIYSAMHTFNYKLYNSLSIIIYTWHIYIHNNFIETINIKAEKLRLYRGIDL